jgi:hypothetical protein
VTEQGAEIQARNRAVLDAIRIRRDRLYDAVLAVERALAAPAGDDPARWAASLAGPVDNLQEVLESHVAGTEGRDGLFEQLRDDAPHLLHAVDKLRGEHAPLLAATTALVAALPGVDDDAGVDAVRAQALELLHHLLEHRHRGAELVYDAYAVDISPGD